MMEAGGRGMRGSVRRAGLVAAVLAAGVTAGHSAPSPSPSPAHDLSRVTPEERASYLRRAIVWQPTDIASKDFLAGPQGPGSFTFDQQVGCDYVAPTGPTSGATPKFEGALAPDDVVKVKHGRKNR